MITRKLLVSASLLLIATITPFAWSADDSAPTEKEILRLEQAWNAAYAANDLPKYFSYYAENPILIFYNKRTTLAEYRKMWTELTKTEPLESGKMSDVKILVDPAGDTSVRYQFPSFGSLAALTNHQLPHFGQRMLISRASPIPPIAPLTPRSAV